MAFAALFGAGRNLDAFLMAFRLPNLLRDLFAEGALSTAFVATFSKRIASEGEESAWSLANKAATLTVVFMSVVVLLGAWLTPWIMAVMARGFSPDKMALTVTLARVMWPFILLVSLAALAMGVLNARGVFGAPAMASSYFNLGSIAAGIALGAWMDPGFGPRSLVGLSIGTLVGGAWQLASQFPALGRAGWRLRPDFDWRDPGIRAILSLMGPAVVAASTVQVNVLVNSAFASRLGDGPVSWLSIAFRLMQLPLGVFGVAIGTVALPAVSRSAAVGDLGELRAILARGIRLALLLTVPAALGLLLLSEPIISLIYQRGRFDAEMTRQSAAALRFYAAGLVSYSALKVLAPAFYAVDRKNTPMAVGFLAIGANLLLNWAFTVRLGWGHRGLALSTSAVATLNFLILYLAMARRAGGLHTRENAACLLKIACACLPLAAVCWAALALGLDNWPGMRILPKLAGVGAAVAAGAAAFFAAACGLGIGEARELALGLRGRLQNL
jgi:putative peptidoglycan lipid II flippase